MAGIARLGLPLPRRDARGPARLRPATLFERMLTLVGDTGPRALLRGDPRVFEVPMPSASKDVDLPSDVPLT